MQDQTPTPTPAPAPAPAPPTPPVPLGALLPDRELGLIHRAGPAGAEVHGVHASEMADPSPYLLGGELLLTAGAELAGTGPSGTAGTGPAGTGPAGAGLTGADAGQYVERLVRAGVAALGFGVAPVHETVPPALAEACDRLGLPLLEVPPGTPFSAVARSVWRLMAEARTRELRRVTEAQRALAAAATRPGPVPAVLRRLAASLDGWAALLPPEPEADAPTPDAPAVPVPPLEAAGTAPGPEAMAAVALLARRVGAGAVATATETLGGLHLAAYALGEGRVLALAAPARVPGDHTIASAGAVLLALLTADRPAAGPVTEPAAALTRLLLGGSPAEAVAPGPWYAVHARGPGDPGALAAALGTALADPRGDLVRLVTRRVPVPQPGWRIGVSAPAAPGRLPAAGAEAGRALHRAEAARTPLVRHTPGGLAALLDPAEARAHAEALLAPLHPPHTGTLYAWLAHHGGWDRTAAALGVHRNTVRQRITRCAVLLGLDLDDPDTRMELWFALRQFPGAGSEATPPGRDQPPHE